MTSKEADSVEGSIDELPDDDHPLFGSDEPTAHIPGVHKRSHRHQVRKRRRRRRLFPLLSLVVILVLVLASYVLVHSVAGRFHTPDYSGSGLGFTKVTIAPGDGAEDVAAAMLKAGVVESTRAFVNAAKKSGRSGDIQPGVYRVRLHSSGQAAMAAILDPANRLVTQVTIPEGYTEKQILAVLATKTGLPLTALQTAAGQIANLGLPDGFTPASAEGFLFPATYDFDPGISASAAVQELTAQFSAEYAKLGFATAAKAENLSAYQALIIASLIESEAKFPEDRPKIARVILNRMAAGQPIGIDAANRYGVALTGKDPNSTTYTENSPYNVRTHLGLPPTPVSNPGEASLQAAVQPAAGNWLYYVVDDAAGHHLFTNSDAVRQQATDKCKAEGWCH
ncbi:MAG: endolytic transglycosylase MltG [Actinomycetota bacterium]|nr:endolytic transglycosylase MltG [Actinomycetota bacterium]MDQ2956702.1 endolytic transglycosylase MltG [Actinomycetota bacterium]